MNEIFAALLRKYVSAKKISNSKLTQTFMAEHQPTEFNGYPTEVTPEIKSFSKEFVTKGLTSKDPEFTKFVTENSTEEEIAPKFEPQRKVRSSGEY